MTTVPSVLWERLIPTVGAARRQFLDTAYTTIWLAERGPVASSSWLRSEAAAIRLEMAQAAASDARRMAREGRGS